MEQKITYFEELKKENTQKTFELALQRECLLRSFFSVDTGDFQDGLGSLIEPLQVTLASQFKKK